MTKWYDEGPYKILDLDSNFYLLLYFGQLKEAEDLAKRYFKSITNGL